MRKPAAHFHLPGLFEFYKFYHAFLPLYQAHRAYFYDWCEIASIYGAPEGCIWGGGRVGSGTAGAQGGTGADAKTLAFCPADVQQLPSAPRSI